MRRIFLTLLMSAGCVATSFGQITLKARWAFEGPMASGTMSPIIVELSNRGQDRDGSLSILGGTDSIEYPVRLPSGSNKSVMLFPGPSYGVVKVRLSSGFRTVESKDLTQLSSSGRIQVLWIGDSSGELNFLSAEKAKSKYGTNAIYSALSVVPEDVPERPVGFQNLSTVVLGEGSERLSDLQVSALQRFVLTGGNILFFGGAASPVLADPRWRALLPVGETTLRNGELPGIGNFSNRVGKLVPGATSVEYSNGIVGARKPYGLGFVSYLSVNLVSEPFTGYEGRTKILSKGVAMNLTDRSSATRSFFIPSGGNSAYGTMPYPMASASYPTSTAPMAVPAGSSPYGSMVSGTNQSLLNNPFAMRLPPQRDVFWVLAAYFIVVIPINFLTLKKLKKLELAWFTAPIISLAFAAILFRSASGLYSAQLSIVNQGVLLGQSGQPQQVYVGNSQMFFPRAGIYDLKLQGVDSRHATSHDEYYGFRGSRGEGQSLPAVDMGEVLFPAVQARNLQFEEVGFTQSSNSADGLAVKLRRKGSSWLVDIRNGTQFPLNQVVIRAFGSSVSMPSIAVGGQQTIQIKPNPKPDLQKLNPLAALSYSLKTAFLETTLTGFRPGPQIGQDLTTPGSVKVVIGAEVSNEI